MRRAIPQALRLEVVCLTHHLSRRTPRAVIRRPIVPLGTTVLALRRLGIIVFTRHGFNLTTPDQCGKPLSSHWERINGFVSRFDSLSLVQQSLGEGPRFLKRRKLVSGGAKKPS